MRKGPEEIPPGTHTLVTKEKSSLKENFVQNTTCLNTNRGHFSLSNAVQHCNCFLSF